MLYNYLKVILRNFLKDQLFSVIIVTGLAVGLAGCLMIAQYIHFELSFDRNVKDRDQIYYTYMRWESPEGVFDNLCHPPIAHLIETSIPEVSASIRITPFRPSQAVHDDEVVLRKETNDQVTYQERESGMYRADPEIFSFLSIRLLAGDPTRALVEPNSMVITESLATKLFLDERPLNRTITVHGDDGRWIREFKITGIMEDQKSNSSLPHPSLLPIKALFAIKGLNNWKGLEDSWTFPAFYTFIKVSDGADSKVVERKINEALKDNLAKLENQHGLKESVRLYPFSEFHFYNSYRNWGNAINFTGDKRLIHFFGALGALILLVSWANNINLTTARAIQRAKEVGLRKVNGANRQNILIQFLFEFLFYTIVSVLISLTLVQFLFPEFARIIGSDATWTIWKDPIFWLVLTVFIFLSVIASGFYPANLLSKYNPAKVLKGVVNKTRHGTSIRSLLVILQFGVSVFMIMSVYVISLQLFHLQNKDLGMTADQVLVLRTSKLDTALERSTAFRQWKIKVQNLESAKITCAVSFYPGQKAFRNYVFRSSDPNQEKKAFKLTGVTAGFPEAMGIPLLHGRDFSDELSENYNKAIITEKAAHELGFENSGSALGNLITFQDRSEFEIIGILKDYRRSAKDIIFGEVLIPPDIGYNYFLVKLSTNNLTHTIAELKAHWDDLFQGDTFDGFYLDSFFATFYHLEQQFTGVFLFFAVIGILITCMGLFGLSLYNTTSRTKETGIRKSLGGTATNIIWLFSKDYLKLVFTAAILALPVSYFLLNKWLENYPNRITLQVDAMAIPLVLMVIIAMATVGYQTFRVAHVNPVESLKAE